MDRVPYRRVKPSRLGRMPAGTAREKGRDLTARRKGDGDAPTVRDTVVLQCVISGILLVLVLLISLINIAPTTALRNGLNNALSGAATVGELFQGVRDFGGNLWGPSPETEPESFPDYTSSPAAPHLLPDARLGPPAANTPTEAGEVLNPQIPGPLVVPELWD